MTSPSVEPPAALEKPAALETPVTVETPVAPRGLRGLFARFEHLVHELGKFGTVGLISFTVDVTIFNVLLLAGVQKLLAGAISMVIAATVAFIGNRFWTWRDRERTNLRREYGLYFVFNLVGLVIALGCLAFSNYVLGAHWPFFKTQLADNLAKNVVGMALGTSFRFWSYRQIVFRKSTAPSGD